MQRRLRWDKGVVDGAAGGDERLIGRAGENALGRIKDTALRCGGVRAADGDADRSQTLARGPKNAHKGLRKKASRGRKCAEQGLDKEGKTGRR